MNRMLSDHARKALRNPTCSILSAGIIHHNQERPKSLRRRTLAHNLRAMPKPERRALYLKFASIL